MSKNIKKVCQKNTFFKKKVCQTKYFFNKKYVKKNMSKNFINNIYNFVILWLKYIQSI